MNPCIEYCNFRFGKQYTPECDEKCDYAKEAKRRKQLEQIIKDLRNDIVVYRGKDFIIDAESGDYDTMDTTTIDHILEIFDKHTGVLL